MEHAREGEPVDQRDQPLGLHRGVHARRPVPGDAVDDPPDEALVILLRSRSAGVPYAREQR
ncbi:hypothetical protein [Nonomuraea sp. B5E05]|uniref:hypothetical protein n=1 Tax=Nonomuraea sp. B5E05 TaxID=3153569 RepID=UPI003261464B